jgi:hypothetical protein
MLFWLAIMVGGGLAAWGRKRGLFVLWQCLFNAGVAIYVAVMLTPRLVGMLPEIGQTPYHHATAMFGLGVILFVILQTTSMTILSGFGDVHFPAIFDGLGAALAGFGTGYMAASFLAFTLYAMPIAGADGMDWLFPKSNKEDPASIKTVRAVCETVGVLSIQFHDDQVRRTIRWYIQARGGENNMPPETISPARPKPVGPNEKDFPPWQK